MEQQEITSSNEQDPTIENPNHLQDHALLSELESLRLSYAHLQSKSLEMDNTLTDLENQRNEALNQNLHLIKSIEEISTERDALQTKLHQVELSAIEREEELVKQKDDQEKEKLEFGRRISDLLEDIDKKTRVLSQTLNTVVAAELRLSRLIEKIDSEKIGCTEEEEQEEEEQEEEVDDDEFIKLMLEIRNVEKLTMLVETRFAEYEEKRNKEKRELENSVVSLTEENRDINSLLRIAIVEKDAVEKALSRLKGSGEQKRVPLLQIAERGLQKVGFGFMMSAPAGESTENLGSDTCGKSEGGSECEEAVVSLASTVEKIMKNLRLEITQLKSSLDESRSDTERLQNLTEKQAQQIAECTSYIKDLEERESRLIQNIEQLMVAITGADEEISRWREACELEVEAGKSVIEEREREITILREELDKTRSSLQMLNNKLKLKEELAAAAMAAQEASQKSLQLADSRSTELRERIEELTRQLEEADNRGERNNRRKVRHICWPWRVLRTNPGDPRSRNVRRMIPEMQGLLHYRI